MKKGTVYFFTGLAGAGKTTIGGLFYRKLLERNPDAVLIDGDQNRLKLGHSAADGQVLIGERYTTEARKEGARMIFRRCRKLSDQGLDVVVCSTSLYHEIRAWNRENIENYREIYLKVKNETLYQRDQKGLYSSRAKNVVGVDLPYDEPECPDLIIQNDGEETPERIVERLERFLGLT